MPVRVKFRNDWLFWINIQTYLNVDSPLFSTPVDHLPLVSKLFLLILFSLLHPTISFVSSSIYFLLSRSSLIFLWTTAVFQSFQIPFTSPYFPRLFLGCPSVMVFLEITYCFDYSFSWCLTFMFQSYLQPLTNIWHHR